MVAASSANWARARASSALNAAMSSGCESMDSQAAVRRSHKALLSRAFRAKCVNRVTPINAGQKVGELRGRDRDRVLLGRTRRHGWRRHVRRPNKAAALQPLGIE